MKFGLPFKLGGADEIQWDAPGSRDQKFNEAAKAVAGFLAELKADIPAFTKLSDRLPDVSFKLGMESDSKSKSMFPMRFLAPSQNTG